MDLMASDRSFRSVASPYVGVCVCVCACMCVYGGFDSFRQIFQIRCPTLCVHAYMYVCVYVYVCVCVCMYDGFDGLR